MNLNNKELADAVNHHFKNINVLVVGDIMLDKYIWGTVDRISPEAPVPVVKQEKENSFPGGAANVASNIVSLGGNPFLVSCRGNSSKDKDGIQLMNSLTEKRVSHKYIVIVDDWQTIVKTRIIAHNQQVVRIDQEINNNSDDHQIIESVKSILKNNDIHVCIISDYVKNTLTPISIKIIIQQMKKKGIPIIVDSKRRSWESFNDCTIITPNLNEIRNVGAELIHVEKFFDIYRIQNILVTLGEKGMKLFSNNGRYQSITFGSTARTVYDVTGAGDTVVAALSLALGSKLDTELAVFVANVAAGLSVEKIGTSTVTLKELYDHLEKNNLKEVIYD
jgi:D-beta-D-heptose 7-phosphate kinase/D-beta-D-heptose 1-phosphate adenosyltransferase